MLRDLTRDDMPALLELAREMHQAGVYSAYPMDEARVAYILTALIDAPEALTIGYQIKGDLAGAFLGEIIQDLWVDVRLAVNQMVYVRKASRSSKAGFSLIEAYTKWAEQRGADVMHFTVYAGINNDAVGRTLQRLGYAPSGGAYNKEI
jgi:GNAT superfamily N-acetyltransferase